MIAFGVMLEAGILLQKNLNNYAEGLGKVYKKIKILLVSRTYQIIPSS